MPHRIQAQEPPQRPSPQIESDADRLESFLSDAAHVPGGHASGIAFPRDAGEVAALVRAAGTVLVVGAQSSLTGGATPRGELLLSTRALSYVGVPNGNEVRVGAGVPLKVLQQQLAAAGLYYPPVPTFDGAFVGGTIATNAAGAATFKHGSTRRWVRAITVVLADGSLLHIRRGDCVAAEGAFEIACPDERVVRVPVPSYTMPKVAKLSAGYFAAPGMDLIDLFIGSEGTLGIVVDASLGVIARPRTWVALVECADDAQAVGLTAALRNDPGLDVAAIEFMDSQSLAVVPNDAFVKAGVDRPLRGSVLLLMQLESGPDETAPIERLATLLEQRGVATDPVVASPGDITGAARLFELREAVPASVNALIGARKQQEPELQKTAGDMVVPFERLEESIALYRRTFTAAGLEYAIWGHVSDGNLHPNVIPASKDHVRRGVDALGTIAREVIAMGGAPLAEHGVGRSALKQELLRELYGDKGIEEMRAVKRALDPNWKLAPGVLFPRAAASAP